MRKSLLLVVGLGIGTLGLGVSAPSPAEACIHTIEREIESDASILARAEKALDRGDYGRVRKILKHKVTDRAVKDRAADVLAVARIRGKLDGKLATAVAHLELRRASDAGRKDVRFQAWLAEGYVAVGRDADARAILADLHAKDLMPDAYAYHALARVSSGTARYEAYQACVTRAANKSQCELPAVVTGSAAARASS